MADFWEPTREQREGYRAWVSSRPLPAVRKIAERLTPWGLYRMKSTGHRVSLLAIAEDGTVRVDVSAEHNLLIFGRQVFGVDPDDLEPCELPTAGEMVGALVADEDVEAFIDEIRPFVLANREPQ